MKNSIVHYQWIDALKGLLIILVVAMHSSLYLVMPKLSLVLSAGYMAVFFVLSGYTAKEGIFIPGITKKMKRLLFPYIFYGVVITAYFSIVSICNGYINTSEWFGLLYSRYCVYPLGTEPNIMLLSSRATAPLWFLTSMFVSFVWFYVYVNLKHFFCKIICIISYLLLSALFYSLDILLPWSIDTSFICALFIITGYELSSFATKVYKKSFIYFLVLLAIALVYILLVLYNGDSNLSVRIYGNFGYASIFIYYLLSVFATILYSELLKMGGDNIFIRCLAYTGKNSLRIMCIHLPLITLFNIFFYRFGILGLFMVFVTTTVTSIVISSVLCKVFQKYSAKYELLKYL